MLVYFTFIPQFLSSSVFYRFIFAFRGTWATEIFWQGSSTKVKFFKLWIISPLWTTPICSSVMKAALQWVSAVVGSAFWQTKDFYSCHHSLLLVSMNNFEDLHSLKRYTAIRLNTIYFQSLVTRQSLITLSIILYTITNKYCMTY